jgi:hypothetical protein
MRAVQPTGARTVGEAAAIYQRVVYLLHVSYVSHATEQNCLNVALRRDGVDISQVRAEGVMVSAIHM